MTKKFWADWQKRIGETKEIYGWIKHTRYDGVETKRSGGSLVGYNPFKILSAKFNGDTVDLKLEVIETVFNRSTWGIHNHVENKYITLHRTDISDIKFTKY